MSTHNTSGVEYAKLSETKAGDILIADGGSRCVTAGTHVVQSDGRSIYVACRHGKHFLRGQCDDGEHIVGFTKAAAEPAGSA